MSPVTGIPPSVQTDAVLMLEWKECFDLVALRNNDYRSLMAEQYSEYQTELALAAGTYRTPRPKIPYVKELIVVAGPDNHPLIQFGTHDAFTEPPPPAPKVATQTYTDSKGVVWYRTATGRDLPWGPEYTWSTMPPA